MEQTCYLPSYNNVIARSLVIYETMWQSTCMYPFLNHQTRVVGRNHDHGWWCFTLAWLLWTLFLSLQYKRELLLYFKSNIWQQIVIFQAPLPKKLHEEYNSLLLRWSGSHITSALLGCIFGVSGRPLAHSCLLTVFAGLFNGKLWPVPTAQALAVLC